MRDHELIDAYLRCYYGKTGILSVNPKTTLSLNVSRERTCKRLCEYCYAATGPLSWDRARGRQEAAYDLMVRDPDGAARRIDWEARGIDQLRCFGVGSPAVELWPALERIRVPWYGFTRDAAAADAFPGRFTLSTDIGSHAPAGYRGRVAYVRRPGDPVDERADVVFPLHGAGRDVSRVPSDPRDCPAIRGRVKGCSACRRCWSK